MMKEKIVGIPRAWVKTEALKEGGVRFVVSPLVKGMAVTLGNSMRRILLSSLSGVAITRVKIDGAPHEFSTIPNVLEDVLDIIFNLKGLLFKIEGDVRASISFNQKGKGIVKGSDIELPEGVDLLNKDHYIAEVFDKGILNLEFDIEVGVGYQPSSSNYFDSADIHNIFVDSSFSPVVRVNHTLESVRIGKSLNYESLFLDVWTNGCVSPEEAVQDAASILLDKFNLFLSLNQEPEVLEDIQAAIASHGQENAQSVLGMLIDDLELSARSSNCLKRAGIETVGALIDKDVAELIQIKNFGKKSADEINDKLRQFNLSLKDTSNKF